MQEILYAQGYLDLKPVLSQADTKLLQTTPTLAAGDFKLRNASQAFTNLAAVAAAFTSGGTAIPLVGETLTGATSTFTAIVVGFFLTSGSWGAGTAAGTLFVEQASGAFTPGENLNGSVGGANILTLTADFVAQPTALAQTGSGGAAVPITTAEATTDRLQVARVDAAGAEWCSDWLEYITTDHPSAGKPNGCIASVAAHASSQTATNIRLNAAPQATPIAGFFVVCTKVGSAPMFGVIKSYSTAGGEYNITLYDGMPSAAGTGWTISVYGDAAAAAARLVASETLDLSTVLDVNAKKLGATTQTGADVGGLVGTIGSPAGASISADVAAVKTDTAAILVDTGTTLDGRIPTALSSAGNMKADVKEVNDTTLTGNGSTTPWGPA